MYDLIKMLEDLASRARMEEAPAVDVAFRVVSRLSLKARPAIWPLALFASGATVCAVITLALSVPLIEIVADPLNAVFLAAANVLY